MLQSIYDGILQRINCYESSAPEQATEDSFQEQANQKSILGFTRAEAELRKKKANLVNRGEVLPPGNPIKSQNDSSHKETPINKPKKETDPILKRKFVQSASF